MPVVRIHDLGCIERAINDMVIIEMTCTLRQQKKRGIGRGELMIIECQEGRLLESLHVVEWLSARDETVTTARSE